jgi:hypothetical protein
LYVDVVSVDAVLVAGEEVDVAVNIGIETEAALDDDTVDLEAASEDVAPLLVAAVRGG